MDAIADPKFAVRVAHQAGVRAAAVSRELATGRREPDLGVPIIELETLRCRAVRRQAAPEFSSPPIQRTDPVEIVFTSGTTSEPRGVVITHGNLLANLEVLEKEINRYRRCERFFHPLRFLDLLPLSHVFGQLLGIFLPQILGGTSVFLDTLNPAEVIRAIHDERVSVLVTVPRLRRIAPISDRARPRRQRPVSKTSSAISRRPKANISSAAGGASAPFTAASAGNSGP